MERSRIQRPNLGTSEEDSVRAGLVMQQRPLPLVEIIRKGFKFLDSHVLP